MQDLQDMKELCFVYNTFSGRTYPILGVEAAIETADQMQRQNYIHAKAMRTIASVIVSQQGTPIYYTIPMKI